MGIEDNQFITGDSSEVLKELPKNSIDLTVCSPPYDLMRTYKGKVSGKKIYAGGYTFPFQEIADQLYRVTRDNGVVMWNVNDQVVNGGETGTSFKMALYFQSIGFLIYDTMIYGKTSPAFPETGRYGQTFEYVFILSKGRPRVFNQIKDKKNRWAGFESFGTTTSRKKDGTLVEGKGKVPTVPEYGSRNNIWFVKNGKGYTTKDEMAYNHPALMPEDLAEGHILSWSNPGDLILDPMGGAGTTAKMAYVNNRKYLSIDINEDYSRLGEERLSKVIPYSDDNKNPLDEFIVSREELLAKRKKKVKDDE